MLAMSLVYNLYVECDPMAVEEALRQSGESEVRRGSFRWGCGLSARVGEVPAGEWTPAEDLGVRAAAAVRFDVNDLGDRDHQQRTLLTTAVSVMRMLDAPAALIFNGETAWALYADGLTLDRRLWDDRRLAWIDGPHELKALPQL